MNGTVHDYMRVGNIHFMAYPQCMGGEGPVVETVSKIAGDSFFEAIEITHMKYPAVRREVRNIIDQSGIIPCFGAQPILLAGKLDLNHADPAARKRAVDAVKDGIDQAVDLGCGAAAVLSGKIVDDKASAMNHLLESLTELSAYAKPKGVTVLLETFDQVGYGKNCLIGPTKDAIEVSKRMREAYPEFGLVLDLSHLPLLDETPEHALRTAGEHLAHVHIGNCAMDDPAHEAYGDSHPRFGAPGTRVGAAELAEFLRVLLDMGYIDTRKRPIVSFEVKPMKGESPEAVIAGSKRTLEAAWRMV